jgi:hypothetical protein
MNDLNPRNYILNLEKLSDKNEKIIRFVLESYDMMLDRHRDFLMGEKTEDVYLAFLNTLNDNGYLKYNKILNNDELEKEKKKQNRKNKIDDILN